MKLLAKARGLISRMKKKPAPKVTTKKTSAAPRKPATSKTGGTKAGGRAAAKPGVGGASVAKAGRRTKSNGYDL